MNRQLLKLKDGAASLTVTEVRPHAWTRTLRIGFRLSGARRADGVSVNISIKSPDELESFCDQLEHFIDDPALPELRISSGRHGRFGGHYVRGGEFLSDRSGIVQVLDSSSSFRSYASNPRLVRLLVPERFLNELGRVLRGYERADRALESAR